MKAPTAKVLNEQFFPAKPRELPHSTQVAIRSYSKRMFGNRDRVEVAVAVSRIALGKVNATDLHRDVDIAVNRIRAQLLALESLGLLRHAGNEQNKRIFEVVNREDRYWKFVLAEYEMLVEHAASADSPVAEGPEAVPGEAAPLERSH